MFREKWTTLLILVLVTMISMILVSEIMAQAPPPPPNKGLAAMDQAAKANKYLFIFFYRQDDPQTQSLWEKFSTELPRHWQHGRIRWLCALLIRQKQAS